MIKDIIRIKLELKSQQSKPLSGWELQDFIKTINKGYSKLDLINEISKLINEGEKPENILIIGKSYEINNKYSYLQNTNEIDLNNNSRVENFYHLGTPISMYPNRRIKEIEIIFSLYRKIYTLFNGKNISMISKDKLGEYINLDIYEAISLIEQDGKNIINKLETRDESILKSTKERLEEYINKYKNKIKKFIEDEDDIENFKKINNIEFNELGKEDKALYKKMENSQYYKEFFYQFNELDRPIILQYQDKDNKLRVIKKEYMLNDVESDNFLDFKSYSHNSPFTANLIAGTAILSIVGILWGTYKLDKGNKQEEEKDISTEQEIQITMDEILSELKQPSEKPDEAEEKRRKKEEILELAASPKLNNINEVKDKFIKNKLENLDNSIAKNIEQVCDQREIKRDDIVVDFEEYRNYKKPSNEGDNIDIKN